MRILYINNDGGGFADFIEIPSGTTIQQLFSQRVPNGDPRDYLIRVNRQPVDSRPRAARGRACLLHADQDRRRLGLIGYLQVYGVLPAATSAGRPI